MGGSRGGGHGVWVSLEMLVRIPLAKKVQLLVHVRPSLTLLNQFMIQKDKNMSGPH